MLSRLFGRKSKTGESTKPLVVMIDDEPDLCEIVRLAVNGRGYEVITAHDGEAGLALLSQRPPALVLLDIKMPRLNGYQVLARMQQDATLSAIPVIVITSVDEDRSLNEQEWADRLQVRGFIAKPFDPEKVADLVAEICPIVSE